MRKHIIIPILVSMFLSLSTPAVAGWEPAGQGLSGHYFVLTESVHGKGTLIYKVRKNSELTIQVWSSKPGRDGIIQVTIHDRDGHLLQDWEPVGADSIGQKLHNFATSVHVQNNQSATR